MPTALYGPIAFSPAMAVQAALAAVDAGALGVATDLQEDLAQFVRQLARANVCVFPAAAHQLVAELQIEVGPIGADLNAVLAYQPARCKNLQ